MASLSEGSREIEGARLRLASAKTQASAAFKNMDSAKLMSADAQRMMETAKSMMDRADNNMKNAEAMVQSSSKEVEEAAKCLKDAEKRWEVIEIDDSPRKKEASNKRRKVSLSPQGPGNNTPNSAAAVAVSQQNSSENTDSSSDDNADQFVVEGCRIPELNGTYSRAIGVSHAGAPVYAKTGSIGGGMKNCVIYRKGCTSSYSNGQLLSHNWCIGWWEGDPNLGNGRPSTTYCHSYNDDHYTTPPENNWLHGITCRPVKDIGRRSIAAPYQDQIVVEGCGTTELNGIYKLSGTHDGAPEYTRTGEWEGLEVTFAIFREYPTKDDAMNSWCIGRSTVTGENVYNMTMFKSDDNANCMIPPQNGHWYIIGRKRGGVQPAPKCRPGNSSDNVVPENATTAGISARSGAAVGGTTSNVEQVTRRKKGKARYQLTPQAKVALREAVLSAIHHPQGVVATECLQRAVAEGLPRHAVLNAAIVARQRDALNKQQRRQQV